VRRALTGLMGGFLNADETARGVYPAVTDQVEMGTRAAAQRTSLVETAGTEAKMMEYSAATSKAVSASRGVGGVAKSSV
jgi:hypothetical protein